MPKNIVATPAAVVAVDRLTLQADDARGGVAAHPLAVQVSAFSWQTITCCFSEE